MIVLFHFLFGSCYLNVSIIGQVLTFWDWFLEQIFNKASASIHKVSMSRNLRMMIIDRKLYIYEILYSIFSKSLKMKESYAVRR